MAICLLLVLIFCIFVSFLNNIDVWQTIHTVFTNKPDRQVYPYLENRITSVTVLMSIDMCWNYKMCLETIWNAQSFLRGYIHPSSTGTTVDSSDSRWLQLHYNYPLQSKRSKGLCIVVEFSINLDTLFVIPRQKGALSWSFGLPMFLTADNFPELVTYLTKKIRNHKIILWSNTHFGFVQSQIFVHVEMLLNSHFVPFAPSHELWYYLIFQNTI